MIKVFHIHRRSGLDDFISARSLAEARRIMLALYPERRERPGRFVRVDKLPFNFYETADGILMLAKSQMDAALTANSKCAYFQLKRRFRPEEFTGSKVHCLRLGELGLEVMRGRDRYALFSSVHTGLAQIRNDLTSRLLQKLRSGDQAPVLATCAEGGQP